MNSMSKAMKNLQETKKKQSKEIGKKIEEAKLSKAKKAKKDKKQLKEGFIGHVDTSKETPLGSVKDNNGTTFDIYEKNGKFVDANGNEVESNKVKQLIPEKQECLKEPVEPVEQKMEARYIQFNQEDKIDENKVNEGLSDEFDPVDENWYEDLNKIRTALKDLEGTFFYPDADEIVAGFEVELDKVYDKGPKQLDLGEKKEKGCIACNESKIKEINERTFNRFFSRFIKENYKNAKNIRISSVKESKTGLKLEGKINYKSGKIAPIVFEIKDQIKEGKSFVKIYESKNIVREEIEKPLFTAKVSLDEGILRLESIRYNYKVALQEGKKANVYGIIKD